MGAPTTSTSSPLIFNPYTTTTTTPTTTTTTTTAERVWQDIGDTVACDANAGETSMPTESGKVGNLDACRALCETSISSERGRCQSFTYWNSGFCSLYSTSCENTVAANKVFLTARLVEV